MRRVWRTSVETHVALSQKKHQERVTHEGLSNIYYDPLLGLDDWVCSDLVCSIVKSGSFTFCSNASASLDSCVYMKNLSLRLFGRQTIQPTFQVTSNISHGNWDSF